MKQGDFSPPPGLWFHSVQVGVAGSGQTPPPRLLVLQQGVLHRFAMGAGPHWRHRVAVAPLKILTRPTPIISKRSVTVVQFLQAY